jgi:hypothetical protein
MKRLPLSVVLAAFFVFLSLSVSIRQAVLLLVGVGIGRSGPFTAVCGQRWLGHDGLGLTNTVSQSLNVARITQKLGVNQRRAVRVAVVQQHTATTVGLQQTHMQ